MRATTEDMVAVIRDLMTLKYGETWRFATMSEVVKIEFYGNYHEVRREIYKWLSEPSRKEIFERMGD